MPDRNITLGQLRFIWRFMEARALLAAGILIGFGVGWLVG